MSRKYVLAAGAAALGAAAMGGKSRWKRQSDGSYLWSRGPGAFPEGGGPRLGGGSYLIKREQVWSGPRRVTRWALYRNIPADEIPWKHGWQTEGPHFRTLAEAKKFAEPSKGFGGVYGRPARGRRATTYFKGDKARYTGKSEVLHGGLFYEVVVLEGHRKGEKKWVHNAPGTNVTSRGRRAERKDEVWADGKLLYAGDDWREAKATYLLYTQTAPGRAWVTGWARIPRKGSHVIWRQKAPHSPGGVEGPWVFVGIASRTQEEGSKYRARLAKAYAKKGSRAARAARGRRAASGSSYPRTYKQLNKWFLANGYGYEIVVTRQSGLAPHYGGWHRWVDDVDGHPHPFGESVMWWSSSVYALSPSIKTYDEWVEALRALSQREEVWWA